MLPLRLTIEDFKTHRLTDIDCSQFETALIVGQDRNNPRRANGVGKTTIFEAIDFALFNHSDVNLDDVIRFGCQKCRVTFTFENSHGTYRIIRSRAKKKGDLKLEQLVNDDWADITAKTASETEAEIAKIIRISHVAFKNSVLFAQDDLRGLAAASPKDRKTLLKEPLQLTEYAKYEKIAKAKVTPLNKELDATIVQIANIGDPTADINDSTEKVAAVTASIAQNDNLIIDIQSQLDIAKARVVELSSSNIDSSKLSADLTAAKKKYSEFDVRIKTLQNNLSRLNLLQESTRKEIEKARDVVAALEAKKAELDAAQHRSVSDIELDITSLATKETDGVVYLAKVADKLVKLKKPITAADLCESCNQTVTEEHRQKCETERLAALEKATADQQKYSKVLESIRAKKVAAQRELAAANARIQAQKDCENQIKFNQQTLGNAEKALAERLPQTQTITDEIAALNTTMASAELDMKTAQALYDAAIQNSKTDLIRVAQTEVQTIESKLKSVRDQNTNLTMLLGSLNQKIETRTADLKKLDDLRKVKAVQEKTLARASKIAKAFSYSGIPTMIINTILDDLQINVNDLLAQVRPDIQAVFSIVKTKDDGKQEDTLDISYIIHGVPHDYKQLSGGQKVMVALCLKLALSLVIQHRIGVDIKLLELDEVDMPFDDEGLDAYVEVIKKWQKKFKVLLISHNKYVQSKFSQVILVEKENENCSVGKLVSHD